MFALDYTNSIILIQTNRLLQHYKNEANGGIILLKLNQKFHDYLWDPTLLPLLSIIRGLTRLGPLDRISSAEAFQMISS
jgi:hypothetical protein